MIPKISYYTDHNSVNAILVEIGNLAIWFSYKTPVAFQIGGHPRVISVNYWGATTGAHLNAIDPDKSKRVKEDEFKSRLGDVIAAVDHSLDSWSPL